MSNFIRILLVITILNVGCSEELSPVQVNSELKFGPYIVSPPMNYWYFPREYPGNFNNSGDSFLLTFWEKKQALIKNDIDNIGVFFNIGVSENKYNNIEEYYTAAKEFGIKYDKLPDEANDILVINNWNCKQTLWSGYGIECNSLRDNLVTIAAFGKDKSMVLSKIHFLKEMLETFKKYP